MPLMPWVTHVVQWSGQRVAIPRWLQLACMKSDMPLSFSGSGHLSFKEATGFRLPLGVLQKEVDHGLSISLEGILPGSMPELLMGTDCKFVGDMSTLVQIQLGLKIRRFMNMI
ncbi:hypothetical protein Cni_G14101 [Canna indica]|uniref:Uncharacterized protein n=1 Tax=Canna indica TaxID=4628 RepID=A0AAQ3KAS9_9LILI|nr:hypothetical protein Cni_G14101 [Canna indica]